MQGHGEAGGCTATYQVLGRSLLKVYCNTNVILREEVWSAYRAQVARENSFHHRAMALINALEW